MGAAEQFFIGLRLNRMIYPLGVTIFKSSVLFRLAPCPNPSMSTANKSPRVTFSPITPNNLGTVRKLNSVLFPIRYGDKFYSDILLPEVEDFCKLGV